MTLDSGLSTLDTRLGGGDRRAFERLYESYAAMVHGILLARIPRIDVVGMPLLQKEPSGPSGEGSGSVSRAPEA